MNRISGKVMFPYLLAASLSGHAVQAAYQPHDWGRVNMQGSIIDSACAIATESQEQVIDMDVVPVADILRTGWGNTYPLSIELINCTLTPPKGEVENSRQFQMTFDGEADGKLFGIGGEAKGIALQISDERGNIATPGNPLPVGNNLYSGMRLNYHLRIVSNSRPLHAGVYSTALRFRLDYY